MCRLFGIERPPPAARMLRHNCTSSHSCHVPRNSIKLFLGGDDGVVLLRAHVAVRYTRQTHPRARQTADPQPLTRQTDRSIHGRDTPVRPVHEPDRPTHGPDRPPGPHLDHTDIPTGQTYHQTHPRTRQTSMFTHRPDRKALNEANH